MKQKNKKKSTAGKRGVSFKKTTYIGVGLAGGLAIISLLLPGLSRLYLPSEESMSLPLPTAPPLNIATAPPERTASPTAPPFSTATPEAAPAMAKAQPFRLIMPAEGEIMTDFSTETLRFAKTMGDWRVHTGIDIRSASGAEVKAAADGIVEKAEQDVQMGHTIILTHENGYQTVYQNLASTEMVTVGEQVVQGQGIAAVGNSAAAELLEDSHLHFAVLESGIFKNPLHFMQEN